MDKVTSVSEALVSVLEYTIYLHVAGNQELIDKIRVQIQKKPTFTIKARHSNKKSG